MNNTGTQIHFMYFRYSHSLQCIRIFETKKKKRKKINRTKQIDEKKITHFCPNLERTTRVTETLIIITISSETAGIYRASLSVSLSLHSTRVFG